MPKIVDDKRTRRLPRAEAIGKGARSARVTADTAPGAVRMPMPQHISPMLATLVDSPFDDPAWLFETKWDGVRALCYLKGRNTRLITRNDKEVLFRYPELIGIHESVSANEAILDGEIVTFDRNGRSVFQWLQSRIGLVHKDDIELLAQAHPAVYCVFDLLYCDGFDLRQSPLVSRKELLATILKPDRHIALSKHTVGKGIRCFEEASNKQWEGIIAKLGSSPYVERRSPNWVKIKTVLRQEAVIAGFTPPRRSRMFFGALVAGLYDEGVLRYVGRVGGGFDHASLEQVYKAMKPLVVHSSPFESVPPGSGDVQWVKPRLVFKVRFAEWTAAGLMRQPIFEGLRDDKAPEDCRYERSSGDSNRRRLTNT